MLKNNAVYEAEITDYTADGMGIAHADGCAVFIPNAIAGERVRISIVHAGKNKAIGKIEDILERSPHRIVRDCPWAKICGGCDFRHMDYAEELRLKAQRVRDALARLGGWDPGELPIAGAKDLTGYRNKAIFPVGMYKGKADAGFYRARTHDLIPADHCLLQNDAANAARQAVVDFVRENHVRVYDEGTNAGLLRHIFVRTADATGQVMVCLIANGDRLPKEQELCKLLRDRVPALASVILCTNTRPGNAIMGEKFRTLWGADAIEDELCGLRFRLSPRSFYQVNHAQAEVLYEKARTFAGLTKSDTVLDLYCGTGTITLHLARDAGQAVGVELVDAAIADAKQNAARNGIDNARFFCADAGQAAQKLLDEGLRPDVVVVDPPRKGLAPDVVETIARMNPDRVVYVSCDPATLARDVARFRASGYAPQRAECVDLFPRCAHVETVTLLSRRKDEPRVQVTMTCKSD